MATITSFAPIMYRNLVKATIIPITPKDKTIQGIEELGQFLLNPETWNVSKEANWVKHDIPGLSDPIQQWTSGKARTVTFQALVTRDMQNPQKNKDISTATSANGAINVLSSIGTLVLQQGGISVPTTTDAAATKADTLDLGISEKLKFYMSLVYPNVYARGGRVFPPNAVRLVVGGTFGDRIKSATYVVDKVEITITKQFADLTPIEAVVTFSMTELVDSVLSSKDHILKGG